MRYFPQSSDNKIYFWESISNMSNCGLNVATASGLLFTPWLNNIFGPHLPAFGSRCRRCLGVRIQIFSEFCLGKWPFLQKVWFWLIKKVAQNGRNSAKLTFDGLKYPPEMRVEHKTCCTICRTHVQGIVDSRVGSRGP